MVVQGGTGWWYRVAVNIPTNIVVQEVPHITMQYLPRYPGPWKPVHTPDIAQFQVELLPVHDVMAISPSKRLGGALRRWIKFVAFAFPR